MSSGDRAPLADYPGPVELTASRRSSVLLAVAAAVLVVAAIVLLTLDPEPRTRLASATWIRWAGWAGLVAFVPSTIYLAWRAVRPRVALRLDADGLVDASSPSSVGRVGWDEVVEARAFQVGTVSMVGVLVGDPEAVLARLTPVKRAVAGANRTIADTPVWISAIGIPADDIAALVNSYRHSWGRLHSQ